ncbi:DNA-directed RNA polymerase subunit alpha C-terminal domain-containing protein [Marinobacter halodurans]|uniref:DNA-directed RNA polymerase subunit alpha C-terminal domain-containing protein n=1 Tax=Marinobacter halodurans TaxID=2528979 RepID=UPI0013F1629B|nr:DNA-directed RNA polymerase subunit alpha C-terminal domain-containing protein [Marinobacter halodurans]
MLRFELHEIADNTEDLKRCEGIMRPGVTLILLAEKPERYWVARSSIGSNYSVSSGHVVLMCPGSYELVHRAGIFSKQFLAQCRLYSPSGDLMRLGATEPGKSAALEDPARPQKDHSLIPCSNASDAFVWNVLQVESLANRLIQHDVSTWEEFCRRYFEFGMPTAVEVAAAVKQSVQQYVIGECRNGASVTVIADGIIKLAQAMPPWNVGDISIANVRVANALQIGQIRTIKDLQWCNPVNLIKLPNFGERSLRQLLDILIGETSGVKATSSEGGARAAAG